MVLIKGILLLFRIFNRGSNTTKKRFYVKLKIMVQNLPVRKLQPLEVLKTVNPFPPLTLPF